MKPIVGPFHLVTSPPKSIHSEKFNPRGGGGAIGEDPPGAIPENMEPIMRVYHVGGEGVEVKAVPFMEVPSGCYRGSLDVGD